MTWETGHHRPAEGGAAANARSSSMRSSPRAEMRQYRITTPTRCRPDGRKYRLLRLREGGNSLVNFVPLTHHKLKPSISFIVR